MEAFFDSTLLTILVIMAVATVLALWRARKRDRCMTHFDGFHATVVEKDGRLNWGKLDIYTSGIEIHFPDTRRSEKGFWVKSFLFYRDQFEAMDGIYRNVTGLADDQQQARQDYLQRTANPGIIRRMVRKLRTWLGMIRDALIQSAGLLIGAAKSRAQPAAAVLTRDEERLSTLSAEIIGHAGNSYDPLLEEHLFTRVIIDLTRQGKTYSYCGYLADYTAEFLEIIDAQVNEESQHFGPDAYQVGEIPIDGLSINYGDGELTVKNQSGAMVQLQELIHDNQVIPVSAIIPDGFVAALRPGLDFDPAKLSVVVAAAERVDILMPRAHAIVRHGVTGLELADIEG